MFVYSYLVFVILLFLIYVVVDVHSRAIPGSDIIFPEDTLIPRIDISMNCSQDSTFCETYEFYPYEYVKEVLEENKAYKDLLGVDEIPKEFSNRLDENGGSFVCSSIQKLVYPKIAKNRRNKWRFIINQGQNDGYEQGVVIEFCRNLGAQCDLFQDIFLGYSTVCKQKYVYRKLLALNENGRPIPDTFKLPSACSCYYTRMESYFGRI